MGVNANSVVTRFAKGPTEVIGPRISKVTARMRQRVSRVWGMVVVRVGGIKVGSKGLFYGLDTIKRV